MRPNKSRAIEKIKKKLAAAFKIVNMRLINFYLGLKINWNQKKKIIKLSQLTYIHKVLIKYYFDKGNPTNMLIKKVALGSNFSKVIQTKKKKY